MQNIFYPLLLALLCHITPASAFDFNPLGYVKDAVEAVAEDRSSSDIGKDSKIKASIVSTITDKMGTDVVSVSTDVRSEEHTSELQSRETISYAVFCLKKKKKKKKKNKKNKNKKISIITKATINTTN